jgi:hypothetical protein
MDALDVAPTGIDSLEHLRGFELACSKDWSELLSARRAALAGDTPQPEGQQDGRANTLARYRSISLAQRNSALSTLDEARCETLATALVSNGIVQAPTLASITAPFTHFYATSEWRATFDYIPAPLRKDWIAAIANPTPANEPSAGNAYAEWAMAMVAMLNKRGSKFLAGTDGPAAFLTPGFGLHQELVALVAAGLSPMQALTAATLRPAEFTRMQDKLGTIGNGQWADMVLLDANPLDNIRNAERIAAVIKDGQMYDRAALQSMLAALKTRNAQ